MIHNANRWMKVQQVEYSKLCLSNQMIRARLTALELLVQGGYSIDSDNYVNMSTAPPLPLPIEPPPQYAAEIAAVMLHKEMAPIWTQVAQKALESHERVRQLEQPLKVLVIPQPHALTVVFTEAMKSRGVSLVANLMNIQVAAQWSGVTSLEAKLRNKARDKTHDSHHLELHRLYLPGWQLNQLHQHRGYG